MPTSESDVIAMAWQLQQEGIDVTNLGRPADGVDLLRRGLDVLGWVEGNAFYGGDAECRVAARLLSSLAYAESELGHVQYGLRLLDVADEFAAPEDEGIVANQRGLILFSCGRHTEALRSYSFAEPSLIRFGHTEHLVKLLLNRGQANNNFGRYREARHDLIRCAELAEEQNYPELLVKAIHARGSCELGLGNVPGSLALFARAESLYRDTAPAMLPQLALSRALALRDAGLRHEAAAQLDWAIIEFEHLGRDGKLLSSEQIRSVLAVEMGDYQAAIQLATRAQHRARQQGVAGQSDWAERTRREAEFRLGDVDELFAVETLAMARRQPPEWNDVAKLAELLAARAFIRTGNLARAQEILGARSRMAGAQLLAANATRHLARAELAWAGNDRTASLAHLRSGLVYLHRHRESFGSLELQAGVSSIGTELAEMGLGLALDSGRPSTVFDWAERSRNQAFRLPSVRPLDDPEIADKLAKLRDLRAFLIQAKKEGVSADAERAECEALESELRQRDWQTTGPGTSAPEVKPRHVHEALAETDRALVSFIHHDGHLHALTMLNGRNKLHDIGSLADVEENLQRLLADLNAITGRRLPKRMADAVRRSIQRQSAALDDRLFAPLRRKLGDRELVVTPTKTLYAMPWGLLPTLNNRPVTVSPSAAVWLAALRHEPDDPGHPLLASGPGLPLAEAELDTISEHYYDDPVLLRDTDATPTAILTALDGARIAHLAAHGHHEPDNVLFSRLDFSGGPLMAYDIARLRTPPAHVTLSACDVGQSKVSIGDETLGFTAALLAAGTRTVVSSVAKVEHETAAAIMTAYHANLVEGLPPAHALAEAARPHPFSPFVCYGAS